MGELLVKDGGAEAQFHLATMKHTRQDLPGTIAGYGAALMVDGFSPRSTVLAHRGLVLALLATNATEDGLAELAAASRLEPLNLPVLSEAMTLSLRHGKTAQALARASKASAGMFGFGRIRYLAAPVLAGGSKGAEAARTLRDEVEVLDIRESEDEIAALWEEVCPSEPGPAD